MEVEVERKNLPHKVDQGGKKNHKLLLLISDNLVNKCNVKYAFYL